MSDKREHEGDHSNGNGDAKKAKMEYGEAGTVLFTGATDWEYVGRKKDTLPASANTIWKPHRLEALKDVKIRYVSSGPVSVHMFAISDEGKVYGWGRNEKGQLGLGDTKDRKCPTPVEEMADHNVVAVATGKHHTLFLTDNGEVYACGDNRFGQTVGGKGTEKNTTPKQVVWDGPPASRVACGGDFSGLIDVHGKVWTWGHPEYGQLGHNSDNSFIEKAGKVDYHFEYMPVKVAMFVEKDPKSKQVSPVPGVDAKEISMGANHTVIIDSRNRAFTWGFGGYGRLGHSETGNEMVPRLIKFLDGPRRGITKVCAGGQFNVAVAEVPGTAYMWGQYITSKEANMYPKPVQDLSGWIVRSVACSQKGWMIAADDAVIGVGPSPCYGELGLGNMRKSSASPIEIKTLNKVYILQCGAGISHSLFIARNNTPEDAKALESFEILDQSDLDK